MLQRVCVSQIFITINFFFYLKESEILSTTNIINKKEADKSLKDIDEDEDISTVLEKEINELRTEHEMPLSSRKFQVCS